MKLKTHIERLKEFIKETKRISAVIGVRPSTTPTIFLWRNRFQIINLFTKMILVLNAPPQGGVGKGEAQVNPTT